MAWGEGYKASESVFSAHGDVPVGHNCLGDEAGSGAFVAL